MPARFFLAFNLLKYRKREMRKRTTTTVGTTTAMAIIVVFSLSAETRILCRVRNFKDEELKNTKMPNYKLVTEEVGSVNRL